LSHEVPLLDQEFNVPLREVIAQIGPKNDLSL